MTYDAAPDPENSLRVNYGLSNPYFNRWTPSPFTTRIAAVAVAGIFSALYLYESTPQDQICITEEHIPDGKTIPDRLSSNKANLVITDSAPQILANNRNLIVEEGVNIGLLRLCGVNKKVQIEGTVGTLEIWGKDILVRARTTSRVTTIKVNADDCHIIDQSPHVFPPSSGCTSSKY